MNSVRDDDFLLISNIFLSYMGSKFDDALNVTLGIHM